MKTRGWIVFGVTAGVVGILCSHDVCAGFKLGRARHAAAKAKSAEAKLKRDQAKKDADEARKNKLEEAKAKREEAKQKLSQGAETYVDKRQQFQDRRIQHGINRGYLTPDEIATLQLQQKTIADMESSYLSDGKLTRTEVTSLRSELNQASRNIWAEKHDTDGNQMPAYRLGQNVFANAELTAMLADDNLSPDQARALTRDFRRMLELKGLLASSLSDPDRTKLQAEFDDLLNKYFETR